MELLLIILIALAVAAVVWTLVYVIAGVAAPHKGKLHQRLSAEVHADSTDRTVRSLVLQTQATGLPEFLNRLPAVQAMQRRVTQGFPNVSLARFLVVDAAWCLIALVVVGLITGNVLMAVLMGAAGAYGPFFLSTLRRSSRKKKLAAQLPEALDFLSRVLRAGQTFSIGLQMMSDELAQPLAGEFRRVYDQHSLGQPIEDGLRDMAARLDLPDFAFFATAVVIQRQSGGDMGEVLQNIASLIRKRLRLQQGVKARTAEGRFTGYIMVAFPAIMFVITYFIDPKRGDVMLHTPEGHTLLGIAVGLQLFGLFLIKKITTVNV